MVSETIPPVQAETNKNESVVVSQNTGRTKDKKKEKKLRKKLKKDKEMDRKPTESKMDIGVTTSSSSLLISHTVVSAIDHVNTAESHMTTKTPATQVKMEPTRSRPSDLKITTGGLMTSTPAKTAAEPTSARLGVDDESQDAGEVRSMLQEMMKPLDHCYSLVTPISTPIKMRPFVFPSGPISVRGRHIYLLSTTYTVLL